MAELLEPDSIYYMKESGTVKPSAVASTQYAWLKD